MSAAPVRAALGAVATCVDCGEVVDLGLAFREVVGFEPNRKGGGANAIKHRELTGRWLCPNCDVRRTQGLAIGQGALL